MNQVTKDEQWSRAMEYVSLVSELNYMTQIVIMLYEDPTKVRNFICCFYVCCVLIICLIENNKHTKVILNNMRHKCRVSYWYWVHSVINKQDFCFCFRIKKFTSEFFLRATTSCFLLCNLQDAISEERFHVELHFSPGAQCWCQSMDNDCGCEGRKSKATLGYRSQIQERVCTFPGLCHTQH